MLGLVQDIHRADEAGAERRDKVYALALSTRKRIACPVERQVRQPHIPDAFETRYYLGERFGRHSRSESDRCRLRKNSRAESTFIESTS